MNEVQVGSEYFSSQFGGGFGGAALALVRNDDAGRVAEGIARSFARAGYTAPHIFPVTASAGARR
jgi:galactokinase